VTGILLCCFVILLCVGSLYLILCRPNLLDSWYSRTFEGRASCGCRTNAIYGCMRCGRTACPEHREHSCAELPDTYPPEAAEAPDPVDDVHDTYERAKYFTGEEAAPVKAEVPPPTVVAGQDIDDSKLVRELQEAYAAYRRGVDIYAGARREPSPEVQR
jgi:hypothetical protein